MSISEEDGFFSFLGLPPGKYTAAIEATQMEKLGVTATPEKQEVRIIRKLEGDMVGGVNFCLRAIEEKGAECP